MIPCEFFTSIFLYLISEGRRNISTLWRHNVEPVTLSKYVVEYEQMSKFMVEFISKFHGSDIKIDRVNSILVAKLLIFFNILCAVVRKWRHRELSFSLH